MHVNSTSQLFQGRADGWECTYHMFLQEKTSPEVRPSKWWYRSTYASGVKLHKLKGLPLKGQNFFSLSRKPLTWQGSVLHIDNNPLLREAAGEGPRDDQLTPLRLLCYSEHTNFQSKPKELSSPLKCQLPKLLTGKYPINDEDIKISNYRSAVWNFRKWENLIHVDSLFPKFISFLSL